MGQILKQIADTSTSEIEAGGFSWRVKKVASSDLARVGHASLVVAQAFQGEEAVSKAANRKPKSKGKTNGVEAAEDDPAALLASVSPEVLENMASLKAAVVMAGTVAVGHEGEWEDVRLVSTIEEEDPDAGLIAVASLPPDVDDAIFNEVMSLSTDGGLAMSRLAAFRGSTVAAPNTRPSRAKVRKAAK